MRDQLKRTRTGLSANLVSPKKVPTPFSKRPRTVGPISPEGSRPSSHQLDHCPLFESYERSAMARVMPADVWNTCSSRFAEPCINALLLHVPSTSTHSF